MLITWDERKRLSNLDKHGLDFADLRPAFLARATLIPTKLGRFLAVGSFNAHLVTVVFVPLGNEAIAVISNASRQP